MSAVGGGWREAILDQVAVTNSEVQSKASAADLRFTRVHLSVPAHEMMAKAAAARGISLSGYMRRAAMVQVALDLGMDQLDLFKLDHRIAPQGLGGAAATRDLDGELFGLWGAPRHD